MITPHILTMPKQSHTKKRCYFYYCLSAYSLSCVQLFETPWTAAHQALLSIGFSRQKYWSGLPFPSPGNLPDQGSNPNLWHWQLGSLPLGHQGSPVVKWHFTSKSDTFAFSDNSYLLSLENRELSLLVAQ